MLLLDFDRPSSHEGHKLETDSSCLGFYCYNRELSMNRKSTNDSLVCIMKFNVNIAITVDCVHDAVLAEYLKYILRSVPINLVSGS